ncbi:MAG: hypothetical protein ACXACD_22465 [Candidatus Thorarchaeota archaeon]
MARDEWLQVRMDKGEKNDIKWLADNMGMELSELVRAMVEYVMWNDEPFVLFCETKLDTKEEE